MTKDKGVPEPVEGQKRRLGGVYETQQKLSLVLSSPLIKIQWIHSCCDSIERSRWKNRWTDAHGSLISGSGNCL